MRRTLTAEEIVRKYTEGGQSMAAIARYGRIPVTKVRSILLEAGVTLRNTNREAQEHAARVFAEHGDAIVRQYQEGESGKSLGKTYRLSPSTILSYLDERGVERRTTTEALNLMHQQRRAAKPI